MDRLWVKFIVYPLVAIVAFLLFLYLALPVDRVKTIVEAQCEAALGHRYNVVFTTFELSGISGFEATDIEITSKPPPPNISEEEKAKFKRISMAIDRLEGSVGLMALMTGDIEATFQVQLGEGIIDGQYHQVTYEPVKAAPAGRTPAARNRGARGARGGAATPEPAAEPAKEAEEGAEDDARTATGNQIDVELREVPLAKVGAIRAALGIPLNGTIDGTVSVMIGQRGELLEGKVDLTVGRTALGPGELPFDTGFGKFKLDNVVRIGDFTTKAHVEAGKLIIDALATTGPDIMLEANGNITLSVNFAASRAKINARVKPDPNFLKANNLQGILDLNPKVRNAKAGDWYGLLLSGPLGELTPFPSSRTAAGLDKIKPN